MRKKLLSLTCIIIIFLCFHACEIPSSVEIRLQPALPLTVGKGDLSGLIEQSIKDAIANNNGNEADNIKIVLWNNQDIQTFLLQYDIMKDKSLDYFDKFYEILDDLENVDLSPDDLSRNPVGDLENITKDIAPVKANVDFGDFLSQAEDKVTNGIQWTSVVPIVLGVGDDSMDGQTYKFTQDDEYIYIEGLENVTFANGIFSIDLELLPDSFYGTTELSGVCFTIGTIELISGENSIPAKESVVFDISDPETSVSRTVEFDFAGETLESKFYIVISNMIDESSLSPPKSVDLKVNTGELSADPGVPIIKGVTGLEIDPDVIKITSDDIILNTGDEFIHAQIQNGSLDLIIELPGYNTIGQTWVALENDYNNDFFKEIFFLQEETSSHGGTWPGLSERTGMSGSSANPLPFTDSVDLTEKHLNSKPINILSINNNGGSSYESTITVPEGKISFMLSNNDLDGIIEADITPIIEIAKLDILHIDIADLFKNPPDIAPKNLNDIAKYLNWIKFDKVGIEIEFGTVIPGFEIMITEPYLGINPAPEEYKPIYSNETISFTEGSAAAPHTWTIDKTTGINGELLFPELKFDLNIRYTSGSDFVVLNDVDLQDNTYSFEVKAVNVFFKNTWTEASVDLSSREDSLGGKFPSEEEINLASMFEVLQGFKFKNVDAYLYINGPASFFNLEPGIDIDVEYTGYDNSGLFEPNQYEGDKLKLINSAILNLGSDNYSGALPQGGIAVKMNDIMNIMPEDLRFVYSVELGELTITPDDLKKYDSLKDKLNVSLLMVLPLEVEAEEDAKFKMPNMFEDKEDIFGRSQPDDESLISFINSLSIKVELNRSIFNKGTFYMRREGETEGMEMLSFPLGGEALNIPITGDKLDYINNIYPYKIEEMGVHFLKGEILRIPYNLGVLKIDINADISYELNLR